MVSLQMQTVAAGIVEYITDHFRRHISLIENGAVFGVLHKSALIGDERDLQAQLIGNLLSGSVHAAGCNCNNNTAFNSGI
ncbi:hypothetical protein D3C71_2061240 [compost metagenome]